MHQPPPCQALSFLFPVSEGLYCFFVLALFLRYFQYLSLLPFMLWTVASGFHGVPLSNQPGVNVSGNSVLRSAAYDFPEFILSVVCCLDQSTTAGVFSNSQAGNSYYYAEKYKA